MAVDLIDVRILDINLPVVNEDGTPTKTFEDAWYELTRSIAAINACLEDHETRIAALEGP